MPLPARCRNEPVSGRNSTAAERAGVGHPPSRRPIEDVIVIVKEIGNHWLMLLLLLLLLLLTRCCASACLPISVHLLCCLSDR